FGAAHVSGDARVRFRRVIAEEVHHLGVFFLIEGITKCAVSQRQVKTLSQIKNSTSRRTMKVVENVGLRKI
ncbi:hypothetical protein ACVGW7_02490, partial [Enterobacter intestinihominis]